MVGEIEITADNRSVINPTAEELSMGPLLREAHSSVAHKKLPKRRSDAIGAIGGHCCLAVVISCLAVVIVLIFASALWAGPGPPARARGAARAACLPTILWRKKVFLIY